MTEKKKRERKHYNNSYITIFFVVVGTKTFYDSFNAAVHERHYYVQDQTTVVVSALHNLDDILSIHCSNCTRSVFHNVHRTLYNMRSGISITRRTECVDQSVLSTNVAQRCSCDTIQKRVKK